MHSHRYLIPALKFNWDKDCFWINHCRTPGLYKYSKLKLQIINNHSIRRTGKWISEIPHLKSSTYLSCSRRILYGSFHLFSCFVQAVVIAFQFRRQQVPELPNHLQRKPVGSIKQEVIGKGSMTIDCKSKIQYQLLQCPELSSIGTGNASKDTCSPSQGQAKTRQIYESAEAGKQHLFWSKSISILLVLDKSSKNNLHKYKIA